MLIEERYRCHLRGLLTASGYHSCYVPEHSPVVIDEGRGEVVYVDRDGFWRLHTLSLDEILKDQTQQRDISIEHDPIVCAALDRKNSLCSRKVEPGRRHCRSHREYINSEPGATTLPLNPGPNTYLHRTSTK